MKISHIKAEKLVSNHGTGKKQRNFQMWETAHQVLISGEYVDIIIPDSGTKVCWSRQSHQER